ncbi:peroxynitrite isomerase THAP4-like [Temnothorax longispinosus]|uniref:peroxynitrite isomerase THAP4-like n=1 Tax=Temnothorax longispinosus TaxID=300112 RepID=UPI003A996F2D
MIWCSAPFCNNSTAKGYICKIFPKNLERRAQWVANMNVKNWIPTDRSYLCEVHFSPEMWERRSDKKPKLKPNAVPTIFGYWLTEKTAFRQTEDELPLTNSTQNEQNFAELVLNEEQNVTDQEHQTAAKQEREKKLEKSS